MPQINEDDFVKIVSNIKNEIRTTQIRTMQQVNSDLIMMYFRIGKILYENSLGDIYFIKNIATELQLGFPGLKGFSDVNLRRMRRFYEEYKDDIETQSQLVTKLSWGHNLLLMSKIKDKIVRKIYIDAAIENGWSRSMLNRQIEIQYHKRIGSSSNNFKKALPAGKSELVNKIIKDPYIFDFLTLNTNHKEKELEVGMIEQIRDVLLELGNGWSFVGNQYKLTLNDTDYFIDLLFYHLKLKCYIVVELKATEFIPEYVGKMDFYLSLTDDLIKEENDAPSIGLILCKDKDRITVQYALKQSIGPIGVSSYKASKLLSENILDQLPSEEELNLHIRVK